MTAVPSRRADKPLATAAGGGRRRPQVAVGDGITDLAARPAADAFAAYTGFAYRPSVVRGADHELSSFDQLLRLVLS